MRMPGARLAGFAACASLTLGLCAAPLAVTPGDRMAMADRLFDKGRHALALKEYTALKGEKSIPGDDLLYRLAECERALKHPQNARNAYGELLDKYPLSRHAPQARLMRALEGTDEEKRVELKLLDSDKTPAEIRACALYHIGVLENDADAFARAIKASPHGRYALYAKFRHASMTADSPNPDTRRSAVREFLEIHFGPDPELAREALYMAGVRSYDDKRYGESSTLFRRYLKKYPEDKRTGAARTMAAWSDYLAGKYSDAAAICGNGGSDDADYLLAACAYSSGDRARARDLMAKYLENHPDGRYRQAAELPLARMDFEEAGKGEDSVKAIEAAKRSAALSGSAADRMRLAWAYEKGGLDDQALAEYTAIARDAAGTQEAGEALFRKALMEIRAAKWSAAEMALAEMLSAGKTPERRAEALYWRGVASFMLGHEAEGAPLLKEAVKAGLSLDQNREARLLLADEDFKEERIAEAKAKYAELVREGACERMGAAKIRSVGYFLLGSKEGKEAYAEAAMCGKAISEKADNPEWRQAGKILEAAAEEAAGRYTAAIAAYRDAFSEGARTEDAPEAMLALGILEAREEGNRAKADATLREAVALNASDNARRAKAYIWLARNAFLGGDMDTAEGYATVVITLFDDEAANKEAQSVLDAISAKRKKK